MLKKPQGDYAATSTYETGDSRGLQDIGKGLCVGSSDKEGKQMQSYLDYGPKAHLCQTGMKDLGTELGPQLAGLRRKALSQKKRTFPKSLCFPQSL